MRLCTMLFTLMMWLPNAALATITQTDIRYSANTEEVIFTAQQPLVIQKTFVLPNPPRLVIDIQRVANGKGVGLSPQYDGKMLNNIRFGQFSKESSRLVLDLAYPNIEHQVLPQGHSLKVILKSDGSPPPVASQTPPAIKPPKPLLNTPKTTYVPDAPVPIDKPQHLAKEAKKPVIVIDAGHGGKDTGAIGKRGTIEKDVTLQYARALRKALLKTGRYRVVMTRDSDTYLFLKERVQVARQQKGDAFISLHADSNPRGDAVGLSVYTLSEQASDAEAAALAQQENKADVIGGLDLSVENETVANILIDLAQRETNNKSSNLAEDIVASMDSKIPLITNPHRYAGFRVLKAPDIPSVLVEVGFLSNHEDENRILSREYRERVLGGFIQALDRFFAR